MTLEEAINALRGDTREFPASLVRQFDQRGTLSAKQEHWARKLASEKQPENNPRLLDGEFATLDRIAPVLAMLPGGETLKIKKPQQRPNTLWLTVDGTYAGRLDGAANVMKLNGDGRDRADQIRGAITEIVRDPETHAVQFGQRYGMCAMCGRTLTDPASIARGIGPICAERL